MGFEVEGNGRAEGMSDIESPLVRIHSAGLLPLKAQLKVCLVGPPTVTDFEDPEVAETEAIRLIATCAPNRIGAATCFQRGNLNLTGIARSSCRPQSVSSSCARREPLRRHRFGRARARSGVGSREERRRCGNPW